MTFAGKDRGAAGAGTFMDNSIIAELDREGLLTANKRYQR